MKHLKCFLMFLHKNDCKCSAFANVDLNSINTKKRAYISSDHNRILSEKRGKVKREKFA